MYAIFVYKQIRTNMESSMRWCQRRLKTGLVAEYWQHRRLLLVAVEVAVEVAAAAAMKMRRRPRRHAPHGASCLGRHLNRWYCRHAQPQSHPCSRSRLAPAARNIRCCVSPSARCSKCRCTGAPHRAACATVRAAMTTCSC